MGNIFTASEIVEIGIQIEKNGRDFYNILTGQSKNPSASRIFKYLAGEEEKHIAVFQKISDSLEKYEPAQSYPGEYFAYMSALAGEYVFTQRNKGEEIAKRLKNDREAIDLGIGFEKDSIIFYDGAKKLVPEHELRVLSELIAQEQEHLMRLVELKAKS